MNQVLSLALAGGILVAVASVALIATSPRPVAHFTEFYILGPGGNTSDYPTTMNVSMPEMIILGLANHERSTVDYTLRVDLVGLEMFYNVTSGRNQTNELNRTTWSWYNLTLYDGQLWLHEYSFWINQTAFWKVDFLLYKNRILAQELRLFVKVSGP